MTTTTSGAPRTTVETHGASVGAIIAAAGAGRRLGEHLPKAYVQLGEQTLLEHCVAGVLAAGVADHIVVAAPASLVAETTELLERLVSTTAPAPPRITVLAGGAERTDSVRAALAALAAEATDPQRIVLVHDAARCLTPPEVFHRVVAAVAEGAAGVIPVLPVTDTIKTVDAEGTVTGTPARADLRAVQTPQGFRAADLSSAHKQATVLGAAATDDALLLEQRGHAIHTVEGHPEALKITTPLDLLLAEAFLDRRRGAAPELD